MPLDAQKFVAGSKKQIRHHIFYTANTAVVAAYAKIEETIAPIALETIVD